MCVCVYIMYIHLPDWGKNSYQVLRDWCVSIEGLPLKPLGLSQHSLSYRDV